MRIHSTPPQKPINQVAESFINGRKVNQLRFKAEMLAAGERDGFNYWRSFQDVWRYEMKLGKIPFVIIQLAIDHLGYKHPQTENKVS